jgi:23S rRNA (uracil1939-C5)-methyltransferase
MAGFQIKAPEMTNQQFLVKIESMAYRGYGVAHIEKKVVFVLFSATGDEGWVEIIEEKKNYSIGRLKKLTHSSPWRVAPPCPYFGVCGGCQWQHIDYSLHGRIKEDILKDILRRLGKVKEIPPVTVVPSPKSYGYRVRVQLKVEKERIGYFRERSHQLVDIDHCPISHPLVNQMILFLRRERRSFPPLEEIEINVSPEEGSGILVFHPLRSYPVTEPFVETLLQANPGLKGVAIAGAEGLTLYGDPYLHFTLSSGRFGEKERIRLRISPGSFYQVNPEQNQALVETVLEFGNVNRMERVLDLYAGAGNLTLPLGTQAEEVWGIEENGATVEDGRFNGRLNNMEGCHFIQETVEDALLHWKKGSPDLVVLDPPRTGSKGIVDRITALKPKRIVYVSCDPATFARDAGLFSEKGFELRRITLIDMFPQSYHMEVVGLLTKSSKSQINPKF